MASPLQSVKARHGNKEGLVDALMPLLERLPDESEADFRDRLLRVSNKKLMRLLDRENAVRETFGSREALVDQVVKLRLGREDADLRAKMMKASTGRLLSLHASLSRK